MIQGTHIAGAVSIPPQESTQGENLSHQENLLRFSEHCDSLTVPLHPLEIKPAGNAYTATENIKLAAGSFALLPDELLIQVLEYLEAASLRRLGSACKALYAFSRLEDLWKTLCIEYELPLFLYPSAMSLSRHLFFLPRVASSFYSAGGGYRIACLRTMYIPLDINAPVECLLCNRHLHISNFLSICCILSISRDKAYAERPYLGLLLPLLLGVGRGALPISTCPKPIVPKSPVRTYSLMSSIGPFSALTLR